MDITTPLGPLQLPDSIRTLDNTKQVTRHYTDAQGLHHQLVISIRWDDSCKNGHNTFAITANDTVTTPGHAKDWMGGCLHELVAEHAPELAFALPYHLVSANGPLHYFANATFLAGDRDCWGTRQGEQKRNKEGLPLWQLQVSPYSVLAAQTPPAPLSVDYAPVLGEGKLRDLIAARHCLGNPDDLNDDTLLLPKADLVAELAVRFEDLSPTDRANAVYHAGARDCWGFEAGEQKRNAQGELTWRLTKSPFTYVHAMDKPAPAVFAYGPILGEGKTRELNLARSAAVWPEATDAELCLPTTELTQLLAARLPRLMQEFKTVVESLGFTY